ncbi:TonB-dependent receptor [Sphingomonas sp. BIUV-7]|uniref:TonB-dependent receptor n=1 Tax=Sphingomonas natans TaxID=3063330 RepID=A0ABT8YDB0_9SPHN|nr:TonB-dependent receptor [Sphingomonas sp. BIUV-7]MDO6416334.1 TonB-dependent receptor [Sphingomonas sp. BIUV-7]
MAAPGLAQTATTDALPAAEPARPRTVPASAPSGDILVTARRRSETVQKVPLAISVLDARAIDATGSFNVLKLTQIQPSLQFYSTNPRNTTVNIRGLGQPFGLINDGIEPGVGFYIDQVYYARPGSATFDFLDIERVEVLRGPQGTLYGKNTTAGAISITSKAPSFTPEGQIEVSAGNLGFVQGKASVSGPLSDTVAIRIGGSATKRDGTIHNVTTNADVNAQDNLGVRGTLLYKPTETFKLTLSGDYNRQNPDCCVQIYVRTGPTQRPLNRQFAALAAAFNYRPPSTNAFDRVTDLDGRLEAKQIIGGASLRAEWDVGPGTLTSVTAWRFWDWTPSNDRDFTGLPITTVSQNPSKQDQYTQELRYAGNSGTLDYVGGLYAFYQKIDTTGSQVQGSAASRWLLNPGNVAVGSAGCATPTTAACNPAVLNGLTSLNDIHFKNTSLAAFGQITWHVTDRLRLQPGARVNYDKKTGSYVSTVTNGTGTALTADQLGVLAPQSYQPSFSDWNLSGDFTASFDVARDVLAYATYAKSFKSGGINLSGLPLNAANTGVDLTTQTVKPESVNHYEVGLKSQFLDRRVTFNLAGFWTDVKNYQATVNNGQITVIRGYLANAGKVRTRGIEADASFRPSSQLSLYASGAFTDAKYVKFVNAPCPPELAGGNPALNGATPAPAGVPGLSPLVCDISGQWLPGVSRWAASHGGEYRVPAQLFGDSEFFFGYDGSYRSKFSSNPSRSASTDIAGYYLGNIRAGIRVNRTWEVYGWVRNVFDKDYYEVLATQSGSTGLVVGQPADPRTYGATLKARF